MLLATADRHQYLNDIIQKIFISYSYKIQNRYLSSSWLSFQWRLGLLYLVINYGFGDTRSKCLLSLSQKTKIVCHGRMESYWAGLKWAHITVVHILLHISFISVFSFTPRCHSTPISNHWCSLSLHCMLVLQGFRTFPLKWQSPSLTPSLRFRKVQTVNVWSEWVLPEAGGQDKASHGLCL